MYIFPLHSHGPYPYALMLLLLSMTTQPNAMDLEVTQFYYQGWPDHGVPQYATSVLGFLRHVRRKHPPTDPTPLLVHCSAGVGRTGTFITLDVLLQKIKEEQCLNVYEFVKQLRKGRCQMVQTEVRACACVIWCGEITSRCMCVCVWGGGYEV